MKRVLIVTMLGLLTSLWGARADGFAGLKEEMAQLQSLREEIQILNLLNGLNLTDEQSRKILNLATEARNIREESLERNTQLLGKFKESLLALKEGLMNPKSVRVICWLTPVINVPKGNPKGIKSLQDLTKPGIRVGIAAPSSVCLGDVAKEILEQTRLWEKVRPNIVVEAKDCADLAVQLKL